LEPDGLYAHEIASGTASKIVPFSSGKALATTMYAVSPDGRHLVLTVPKAGVIVVYEISSWSPVALREIGRIHEGKTEFYWPQFSPDGAAYAVQAIDTAPLGETTRQHPRIEIRPAEGRIILRSFPLEDFDFNALFTDTWTAKLPIYE
jgi:hypothetical protein